MQKRQLSFFRVNFGKVDRTYKIFSNISLSGTNFQASSSPWRTLYYVNLALFCDFGRSYTLISHHCVSINTSFSDNTKIDPQKRLFTDNKIHIHMVFIFAWSRAGNDYENRPNIKITSRRTQKINLRI